MHRDSSFNRFSTLRIVGGDKRESDFMKEHSGKIGSPHTLFYAKNTSYSFDAQPLEQANQSRLEHQLDDTFSNSANDLSVDRVDSGIMSTRKLIGRGLANSLPAE